MNPTISKALINPNCWTSALPIIGKQSVVRPNRNIFTYDTKSDTLASSSGYTIWAPVRASAGHNAKQIPRAPPVRNIPSPLMIGELGRCKIAEGPMRKERNAIIIKAGRMNFLLSHDWGMKRVDVMVITPPPKKRKKNRPIVEGEKWYSFLSWTASVGSIVKRTISQTPLHS